MTHMVMGYPSFEVSAELVDTMVAAGVDLMELQIPFSEPIADGPVILNANQRALATGATVAKCMDFAGRMADTHKIPFLLMSYSNILFQQGFGPFTRAMAVKNLAGAIVPDLPPEEGADYLREMGAHQLAPIFIFSPTTPGDRMTYLDSVARGFVYCVARRGVTGTDTEFSRSMDTYLARCRRHTRLPLAVGFGVTAKKDVDFLVDRADIAVIGTQTIRLMETKGMGAVGDFLTALT